MQRAPIIGVFAFLLAAGWVLMPREANEIITGSVADIASMPEAALSCDQPLYLEELELATGLICG